LEQRKASRLSYLAQITSGKPAKQPGQRIVIAGVEKIGKTTLACGAPNSLLIPLEMGYGTIKTARLSNMLTTWAEVSALCAELIAAAKAKQLPRGQSLVWDTASAIERIMQAETLRVDVAGQQKHKAGHNMATAHEGYGKAYLVSRNYFSQWLGWLDELSLYGGINNIVTCHVFAANVLDPAHGEYSSYDLLLHAPKDQKNYGARELLTQWADCIGFMYEPMIVLAADEGKKLSRAVTQNTGRVVALERTPAFTAGNRYGVHGQFPIPAVDEQTKITAADAWNALADPIFKASEIDLFNRALAPTTAKV
jgi:hypothetical protein